VIGPGEIGELDMAFASSGAAEVKPGAKYHHPIATNTAAA
jgi:hypothetical protein